MKNTVPHRVEDPQPGAEPKARKSGKGWLVALGIFLVLEAILSVISMVMIGPGSTVGIFSAINVVISLILAVFAVRNKIGKGSEYIITVLMMTILFGILLFMYIVAVTVIAAAVIVVFDLM